MYKAERHDGGSRLSFKDKFRLALTAIAGLMVALAIGACGSDAGGEEGGSETSEAPAKIFAFSPFPADFNGVTRAWFNGLEQGAEEAGIELEAKTTARVEDDTATYQNFIRSALVEQPDGIIVIPYNATAEEPGLQKIVDDDVPVLIMDQDVPGLDGKVSFVGPSNIKLGEAAAEWLVEQYEQGNMLSNKVGILKSDPGVTSTDDRLAGFKQGLEGSDLTVASELTPNDLTAAEGRTATVDMLSAEPDLGGMFSVTDILALGAAEALRDQDKLDVLQVSVDASTEAVDAMLSDGAIDADVAAHKFEDGRQSVITLADFLGGQDVPPAVDTGQLLVTPENAEEYLKQTATESR